MSARRVRLSAHRWHFQHGPIDLVIDAEGESAAVADAHDAAWSRFTTILDELVAELPALKRPVGGGCPVRGIVARRMWAACRPHRERFVTPMAAVAGAVADAVAVAYRRPGVARAWVNNGGDIALHLTAGTSARIGLQVDPALVRGGADGIDVDGRFTIPYESAVRGVATSGWRGRSFSLGIADSVTVLARTAADADAAATMIANAVDCDDARIVRRPASALKDDSDLGDRLVTVDVPPLAARAVASALAAGLAQAERLRADGTIVACALTCQGSLATTGLPRSARTAAPVASAWHGSRFSEAGRPAGLASDRAESPNHEPGRRMLDEADLNDANLNDADLNDADLNDADLNDGDRAARTAAEPRLACGARPVPIAPDRPVAMTGIEASA